MRTMFLSLLLPAACFAGGVAYSLMREPAPATHIRHDLDFASRFKSRLLPEPAPDNFDLVVKTAQAGADAGLRLYCDVRSEENNYLAAEIAQGRVRLLCVEAGVLRELAAGTLAGKAMPGLVRLRRRRPLLELVCDGRIAVSIMESGFPDGKAGIGTTAGLVVAGPFLQRVNNLVLVDDFMRGTDEPSDWRVCGKTKWEVRSLDNPGRSSNAFIYQAWGKEGGVSIIGRPYWDAYSVTVAAMGARNGEIGLVLAASEDGTGDTLPTRMCLVRWSAAPNPPPARAGDNTGHAQAPGSHSEDGKLEIIEFARGRQRILATRGGGYRPGQWYRLGARLEHGRVTVSVDGTKVLAAASPFFSGGSAGLYTRSEQPNEFDDFRLASLQGVGREAVTSLPWQFAAGRWVTEAPGLACKPGSDRSLALTGAYGWNNFLVSTTIADPTAAVMLGLVVAARDPGNYLAYEVAPAAGRERLVRVVRGERKVLDQGPYTPPTGVLALSLRVDRGYVAAGKLAALVPDLGCGLVGLLAGPAAAGKTAPVRFTSFRAKNIEHPLNVISINEIFDDERLMTVWSGTAGDWKGKRRLSGKYERVFWHRALFYGDAEMEAFLPRKREQRWRLALSICKPFTSKKKNNGYVLLSEQRPGLLHLSLLRNGKVRLRKDIDDKGCTPPRRLRLRKAGPFIVGYIDDHARIVWRDPQPLTGRKMAWGAKGMVLEPEQVRIYSRSLLDYSFNRAMADWRRAGGVWQVTNRWQCDPRWSFMAGMPPVVAKNRADAYKQKLTPAAQWKVESIYHQIEDLPDPTSKLAAVWHKGRFDGDFMIECFVGPMHQFGHSYRQLAKNFCITVCGDGKNLASGYNCIFGGWNNSKSAILRQGVIVREAPARIPVRAYGNIHRMWFRLRVERREGEIRFSAYTQPRRGAPHNTEEKCLLYLRYHDPNPLAGKRLAIWTYDTGILVARCRIAGEHLQGMESPFASYPAEARCIYTDHPSGKPKTEE